MTGFTGQISLGHAAFVGVGAYASAILITRLGISFWLSIPLAGLVSALVGMIIGIPSLRVKGLYLCIATLAAQFIFGFILCPLGIDDQGHHRNPYSSAPDRQPSI